MGRQSTTAVLMLVIVLSSCTFVAYGRKIRVCGARLAHMMRSVCGGQICGLKAAERRTTADSTFIQSITTPHPPLTTQLSNSIDDEEEENEDGPEFDKYPLRPMLSASERRKMWLERYGLGLAKGLFGNNKWNKWNRNQVQFHRRIRRRALHRMLGKTGGGIATECCVKKCSLEYMKKFCC